jgi:NTE family protein
LYDNLALEPIWKNRRVVIASDGGATFDSEPDTGVIWRLKRYAAIMGRQATAIRKRWLISNFLAGILEGTYFGVGTRVEDYKVGGPAYEADLVRHYISQVRTDLDAFSVAEIQILQNHGYFLAEAAARRYLSSALTLLPAPMNVPYPDALSSDFVKRALAGSAKRRMPLGRGRWLSHLFH